MVVIVVVLVLVVVCKRKGQGRDGPITPSSQVPQEFSQHKNPAFSDFDKLDKNHLAVHSYDDIRDKSRKISPDSSRISCQLDRNLGHRSRDKQGMTNGEYDTVQSNKYGGPYRTSVKVVSSSDVPENKTPMKIPCPHVSTLDPMNAKEFYEIKL